MAHILVVDDEPMVTDTLKFMLEADGHVVEVRDNGETALNVQSMPSFDLVISDIIMPEMDGLALLIALKDSNPKAKVIMISGGGRNSPKEYLNVAQELRADGVLAKPFTTSELSTLVDSVLAAP